MAYFRINYFSNALNRQAYFEAFIPNDDRKGMVEENPYRARGIKTLFLLNGYTGDGSNFVPQELARKYHFAIVVPTPENGFYVNGLASGHNYESLVGEELVDYVRRTFGLAQTPEDTYILGLSMGGYGALHVGMAYPQVFGKIGAMSSALIIHEVAGMKPGSDNGVANYEYYRQCFGEPELLEAGNNNPEVQAKGLLHSSERPEIYMCCGTEDFLLQQNRAFHAYLEQIGYPHIYQESAGTHDMKFWLEYTEKIAHWMFG